MARAILQYSLPEESDEHLDALNGGRWKNVVFELDQTFRATAKHGSGKEAAHARRNREILHDLMQANDVQFD